MLKVIVGGAAQNKVYTALNAFDFLIGQGTPACTPLIRNGKCLKIK